MARRDIPALTGLRGVAALCVVWAHYFSWCAPFPPATAPPWLTAVFSTSSLGMSLFFMLSGFVITYNYAGLDWHGAPRASLRQFAWLRFTRLYPALAVFFLLSLIFRHPIRDLGWWVIADLLSIQSWTPWSMPAINGPLMLAWSISTEVGMYLMFAALMLLSIRGRAIAIAAYLVGIIWAALAIDDADLRRWFFYFSPYFRFMEFGIGALAAAFALRYGVAEDGLAHRLLGCRALVFIGTISYSFYLFQDVGAATAARMLGLRIFGYVNSETFSVGDISALLLNIATALTILLALAYAGYRWIERPAQIALRGTKLVGIRRLAFQLANPVARPEATP